MSAGRKNYISGSIYRHLRCDSFPLILSSFFSLAHTGIDFFFVGFISKGALAAMVLAGPLISFAATVGVAVEVGAGQLVLAHLGAKKIDEAEYLTWQGLFSAISLGILASINILLFHQPLLTLISNDSSVIELASTYLVPMALSLPQMCLLGILKVVLSGTGHATIFRNGFLIGVSVNLLLTPWFLFGGLFVPPMGLVGVGYASVIAITIACGYLVWNVFATGSLQAKNIAHLVPNRTYQMRIIQRSFPTFIRNVLTVSIGQAIFLYFISPFGNAAVAAFGIGQIIIGLTAFPFIYGISSMAFYLSGHNFGALAFDRIRNTWWSAIGLMALYLIPVSVFLGGFGWLGVKCFTNDPDTIKLITEYLRIASVFLIALSVGHINLQMFQGISLATHTPVIELCNKIILPGIFIPLLALRHGITGIWFAELLVYILVAIYSSLWFWIKLGQQERHWQIGIYKGATA